VFVNDRHAGNSFAHNGLIRRSGGDKPRRYFGDVEKIIKRISNIEQGIMNVEGMYSIIIIPGNRLSAAVSPFIIRHFLFDIRYLFFLVMLFECLWE
jgi:hypothetical protein